MTIETGARLLGAVSDHTDQKATAEELRAELAAVREDVKVVLGICDAIDAVSVLKVHRPVSEEIRKALSRSRS